MEVDAIIDRLLGDLFLPLLLGVTAAFVYLAVLARVHQRTAALIVLGRECRRRRVDEERLEQQLGYSPRLGRYRRLEAEIARRLSK